MRGYVGGLVAFMLAVTSSAAWASGIRGEIHEYCGEAVAIVIGRPVSFSAKEPSAEFEVQQWIRQPATPQPGRPPARLHLSGGMGNFSGQTFHELARKGRFLVFVFPGNRTGDGRLDSIIEIGENGRLPEGLFLQCLTPEPKTVDELVGQIRLVLSEEYRNEQIQTLGNADIRDPERAEAARRLGALYAQDAWNALKVEAAKPGRDEESATARESLRALFRIDEARTTPICLSLVRDSRHDYQVGTAALLLSRRPSDDPKALDILLTAAKRWETEARYPADHPLPELIQAISYLGKKTPEVEALVMRGVEKGSGTLRRTSMIVAGRLKIRQAVPLICRQLKSEQQKPGVRGNAAQAVATFVIEDFWPYTVHRPMTEGEARESAAEAFPLWRKALSSAPTMDAGGGYTVVHGSDSDKEIYVLVGWQKKPDEAEPHREAVLLYRTDEPATSLAASEGSQPPNKTGFARVKSAIEDLVKSGDPMCVALGKHLVQALTRHNVEVPDGLNEPAVGQDGPQPAQPTEAAVYEMAHKVVVVCEESMWLASASDITPSVRNDLLLVVAQQSPSAMASLEAGEMLAQRALPGGEGRQRDVSLATALTALDAAIRKSLLPVDGELSADRLSAIRLMRMKGTIRNALVLRGLTLDKPTKAQLDAYIDDLTRNISSAKEASVAGSPEREVLDGCETQAQKVAGETETMAGILADMADVRRVVEQLFQAANADDWENAGTCLTEKTYKSIRDGDKPLRVWLANAKDAARLELSSVGPVQELGPRRYTQIAFVIYDGQGQKRSGDRTLYLTRVNDQWRIGE